MGICSLSLENFLLPPLKCGNLFINLLLLSGTQLGRFSIHPLVYLRLNHLVNPNPVSKLWPLSFRICGWNDNISRETSQAVQKQMERENAKQRSQGLQCPWRILTLVQQRVSMQQKEREKKYEWKRDKATALQGKGRERHKVGKAKIHKKPSQQSNGVRLGPSSGRKASSQAFNKQRHSSSFRNCNAHTYRC